MTMTDKKSEWIKTIKITAGSGLDILEKEYRGSKEVMPLSFNTSYEELATRVLPDKRGISFDGSFPGPLILYSSKHLTTIGIDSLCRNTVHFLEEEKKRYQMDILSVSASIREDYLHLAVLIRPYGEPLHFSGLYEYLGEGRPWEISENVQRAKLIVPESAKRYFSKEQIAEHARAREQQDRISDENDIPFLNAIDTYIPEHLSEIDELSEQYYDLLTKDMMSPTMSAYETFNDIFVQTMQYITSVEKESYYAVIRGEKKKKEFDIIVEAYIYDTFLDKGLLPKEDEKVLLEKLDRALFQFYVLQDLIDDPEITDIKVTDPYSIRVRIKGKAYLSNVTFIDEEDYLRFIVALSIKNNIDLDLPLQTFTDDHDENYILRFSLISPYVTSSNMPIIHIRKIRREKMLKKELVEAGMFPEKVADFLCDIAKQDGGVVFAGPPGSGKTTALNWLLEQGYESSAEILVIQESDELFAYRKGVMFEHVVHSLAGGRQACSLEQLGQMALIAGANVFIIGEAKGAEICSAITLSNSGCRTAITIHSPSADKTVDKMADLALRGYAENYEQAKRMLTSFKTIVYMEDFSVKEISQVLGFDEEKKDIVYKKIYVKEDDQI